MLRATFRVMFPELSTAPDVLVDHFLDMSALALDSEVYGTRYDEAQGYLTAHMLALSPYGKNARLQSQSGETTYYKRYDAIRTEVTPSLLVIL